MSTTVVEKRMGFPPLPRFQAWPWRTILLGAAITTAWHDVLTEMWLRWLPAWNRAGASWSERWIGGEGYYHHGPFVLLVSLAMAWRIHRDGEATARPTRGARRSGVLMIAGAMSVLLISRVADVTFVGGFALPAVLLGWVLCVGGWRMGRAYLGPIALLLFMVPLPLIAVSHLNYELKHLAASGSVALVNLLPGWGVRLDGSVASWSGEPPGTLLIGEACSGLRGIVTMSWIAAVLAVRRGLSPLARLTLLAVAIPASIGINVARVAALLSIGRATGVETIAPDTTMHELVGIVCFAGGIVALCGIDALFRRCAATPSRKRSNPEAQLPHATPHRSIPAWSLAAFACAAIGIASIQHPAQAADEYSFQHIPARLSLAGVTLESSDLAIAENLTDHLGRPAMLHRRYVTAEGDWAFDLQIVRHTRDRRALHPPEVCLRGSGLELTDRRVITLLGDASATHDPIRVVGLQAKRGEQAYPVRFVYHSNAGFTTSLLRIQTDMFIARVLGRDATGAMIRIDASNQRTADRAAATLLPHYP